MCLTPLKIKNPYRGMAFVGRFARFHDCTAAYIYVPCGHCPECLAAKQLSMVQRIQMELLDHHAFFFTLTYDNDHLPKLTHYYEDAVEDGGELVEHELTQPIAYADMRHVVLMMKRIRNHNMFGRPFKYLVCSERGTKRHRPHFHGFIFIDKNLGDDLNSISKIEKLISWTLRTCWATNVGSDKKPVYQPLFTYHEKITPSGIKRNFDCHYVNPALSNGGEADVAFYVTKYIFKQDDFERRLKSMIHFNYEKGEKNIYNKIKSRRQNSLGLGLGSRYGVGHYPSRRIRDDIGMSVYNHIRKHLIGIDLYPHFSNPVNGKMFPLSQYYKDNGNLFTAEDMDTLYKRCNIPGTDWCRLEDDVIKSPEVIDRKLRRKHRINHDFSYDALSDFFDDIPDTMVLDSDDYFELRQSYDMRRSLESLSSLSYLFDLEPLGPSVYADDLPN